MQTHTERERDVYIYICVDTHTHMYIIYIYTHREREGERKSLYIRTIYKLSQEILDDEVELIEIVELLEGSLSAVLLTQCPLEKSVGCLENLSRWLRVLTPSVPQM